MQINDFTEPIIALLDDLIEAKEVYKKSNSVFTRRAFVRGAFAYIEGTIWVAKQACLYFHNESASSTLTMAERALLSDQSFDVSGAGLAQERPKYLKLQDNLRFTINMISRTFDLQVEIDTKEKYWLSFVDSIAVRNRLTHPKSLKDYQISVGEVKTCISFIHWFNKVVSKLNAAMLAKAEENAA
jgi:hypothetical protein